jgi:hypothetical protein
MCGERPAHERSFFTIPSTASSSERDRLVRDFVKKAERVHDGEVVLVIVRT